MTSVETWLLNEGCAAGRRGDPYDHTMNAEWCEGWRIGRAQRERKRQELRSQFPDLSRAAINAIMRHAA
jgi:hypothetical protein